jgi:hypothetical protein
MHPKGGTRHRPPVVFHNAAGEFHPFKLAVKKNENIVSETTEEPQSMLILKMLSHISTALVSFAVGTGIVTGARYAKATFSTPSEKTVTSTPINNTDRKMSGIYFVAPLVGGDTQCSNELGEIYPFGWDSYLLTSQMPHIRRMARDGRWFFFETENNNGRSFEFFGIIPDSANGLAGDAKVAIPGKLVRVTNGQITANVDASYLVPVCAFQ